MTGTSISSRTTKIPKLDSANNNNNNNPNGSNHNDPHEDNKTVKHNNNDEPPSQTASSLSLDPSPTTSTTTTAEQQQEQPQRPTELHVLEFFSGIGGMRCALEQALTQMSLLSSNPSSSSSSPSQPPPLLSLASCHAYDISLHANQVYRQNFDSVPCHTKKHHHHVKKKKSSSSSSNLFTVSTKLVEQLSVEDLAACHGTMWTLSPPCQPFTNTRFAKQADVEDKRNKGLWHLFGHVLPHLPPQHKPYWIVLENVQGFATSRMRHLVLDRLMQCHCYSWTEVLLSPHKHCGIPNHRTRYYLVVEASDRFFDRAAASQRQRQQPSIPPTTSISPPPLGPAVPEPNHENHGNDKDDDHNNKDWTATTTTLHTSLPPGPWNSHHHESHGRRRCIGEYLDDVVDWTVFGLSHNVLQQDWVTHGHGLPVVTPTDTQSHCFTAFYGRHIHASTGSVVWIGPNHHNNDNNTKAAPEEHAPTTTTILHADQTHHHQPQQGSTDTHHDNPLGTTKKKNTEQDDDSQSPDRQHTPTTTIPTTTIPTTTTTTTTTRLLDRSNMGHYEGQIRKFTPTELLRLFGFPSTWLDDDEKDPELLKTTTLDHDGTTQPDAPNHNHNNNTKGAPTTTSLRLQTKYKLIGNSINVTVVSMLFHFLLSPEAAAPTTTTTSVCTTK